MCKSCENKLDVIDILVETDVTNGRKIQKKLRKKLKKAGKDVNKLIADLKCS